MKAAGLGALSLALPSSKHASATSAKRPNILFIFADQLRYGTLGCEGNRIIKTPNFDRLASEGVIFDQAFSSCPICSPYRAQIFTGRYPHINGVVDNEYRMRPGQTTIAHHLKKAGYNTAFIGKWHLGHGPFTEEKRHGFDHLFAYNNGTYRGAKYWHNESGPIKAEGFVPPTEAKLTLDFIKKSIEEKPDQPFCAFLSWTPPHWGNPNPRNYGGYPEEFDIYNEDDMEIPKNVPQELRDYARKEMTDYYALTTGIDTSMKTILDALDKWGIADNTIVCFSSDHGDHLSAHGYVKPYRRWIHPTLRASKFTPHEESIHIPFIIRYPKKVKGGRRTDTLFSSVDVMPTLLGLCNLPIPGDVQGKDLSHAVLGKKGEEPDSVFLQILGPGWPPRTQHVGLWRGVRTRRYIYARWIDRDGMRVLYDRQKDPLELRNRVNSPAYVKIVGELEARLQQWLRETGDPFDTGKRLPETGMLDLGQVFTSEKMHKQAPAKYAESIAKYR
jgi:arylsulfatase A-like enzyme